MMTWLLDWHLAGIATGILVALIGAIVTRIAGRKRGGQWRQRGIRFLGLVVVTIGLFATLGGVVHLAAWHIGMSAISPRGELVDVGGYRIHLLCEGEIRDKPPVVWLAGGRATGLFLYHLHARAREVTRSCVHDRSGSGWSDVRPGDPLRIRYDAEDLALALEASGEANHGPYLIVGHSAGGIQAANFASLYPKLTAGAVLLDPSAPLHDYVGAATWCKFAFTRNLQGVLLPSVGIAHLIPYDWLVPPAVQQLYSVLEAVENDIRALRHRPVTSWLALRGASCRDPLGVVFVPGALGDLPLKVIVQPVRTLTQMQADPLIYPWEMSDFEWRNWHSISEMTAKQYLEMSSRSIHRYVPKGTGHNFPYQAPDFVFTEVLDMLGRLEGGREAFSVGDASSRTILAD